MSTLTSIYPPTTRLTLAPALNGRVWISCTSTPNDSGQTDAKALIPVLSLKRILEAVDAREVNWQDGPEAIKEWVEKERVVLV